MNERLVSSPRPDGGGNRAVAVRRRLLADHHGTLAAVVRTADAVVAERAAPPGESSAVTEPLATAIEEQSLAAPLLEALADAAAVVGDGLPHEPTPAPPYLTVTSRGPVLRATLPVGRLVVVVGVFAVQRGETVRYVRGGASPESVLHVEFHPEDGETETAGPDDAGATGRPRGGDGTGGAGGADDGAEAGGER